MPMGVLMPFLLLIFVVNPLLKMFGKGLQLEPWELIIVFSVSYVSVHINELLGRVLATYAVMHYMATPENLWAEYAYGLVQPWMVVEDAGRSARLVLRRPSEKCGHPVGHLDSTHFLVVELYRSDRRRMRCLWHHNPKAVGRAGTTDVPLCTGG